MDTFSLSILCIVALVVVLGVASWAEKKKWKKVLHITIGIDWGLDSNSSFVTVTEKLLNGTYRTVGTWKLHD